MRTMRRTKMVEKTRMPRKIGRKQKWRKERPLREDVQINKTSEIHGKRNVIRRGR